MINSVTSIEQIQDFPSDIFGGKILSLAYAYGFDYDFCRFYRSGGLLIGKYYSDFIAAGECDDFEELGWFLTLNGFSSVLLSPENAEGIKPFVKGEYSEDYVYEYRGPAGGGDVIVNPPLDEVYKILKDGFPDLPYGEWYPDMSHRIRHGVSECYILDGATCAKMFDIKGTAFISLVASSREMRGKGSAFRLLQTVCGNILKDREHILLICRKELQPFYEKVGFTKRGNAVTIKHSMQNAAES